MSNKIPTPHISAQQGDFAPIVLMPGDPLRAKFIAENYLKDVKQVNNVRGMLAYTGTYGGKKVSVMGHGMGNPSIGIYSYELFAFYNVETIIRIGSCGSMSKKINLGDIVIAENAISNSCYASSMKIALDKPNTMTLTNQDLFKLALSVASQKQLNHYHGNVLSSDTFYGETYGNEIDNMIKNEEILAVEMESFALYTNAKKLNKNALTILTVSDSLITHEAMDANERQVGFRNMMELALTIVEKL